VPILFAIPQALVVLLIRACVSLRCSGLGNDFILQFFIN